MYFERYNKNTTFYLKRTFITTFKYCKYTLATRKNISMDNTIFSYKFTSKSLATNIPKRFLKAF